MGYWSTIFVCIPEFKATSKLLKLTGLQQKPVEESEVVPDEPFQSKESDINNLTNSDNGW